MQVDKQYYNPEVHDKYRSLTCRQPWADMLTMVSYRDKEGNYCASKTIEVRSRNTKYRGDVLICSSAKPVDPWGRHQAGVTCGFVELYDVKRVEDFTDADWKQTCIPKEQRPKTGYGWLMRNPRRVVEMPVKGQLGIYDIIVPKGDITEYPREVKFGRDGFKLLSKKISKNGK